MQLVLLHYNNYYNRKVKKQNDIREYYALDPHYVSISDYDFNPNDGVDTTADIGGEYYGYDGTADYLIVCDGPTIVSRWFIMDQPRLRAEQYRLTLYRDLVADNLETVKNAPAFIEKATLNVGDPLLYNNEAITVNQIKTSEQEIKDETNSAWIVGYIKNGSPSTAKQVVVSSNVTPDIEVTNLASWPYYTYTSNAFKAFPSSTEQKWRMLIIHNDAGRGDTYDFNKAGSQYCRFSQSTSIGTANARIKTTIGVPTTAECYARLNSLITASGGFSSYIPTIDADYCQTEANTADFLALDGKYLRTTDGSGALYKIQVIQNSVETKNTRIDTSNALFTGPITTYVTATGSGLELKNAGYSGVYFRGNITSYKLALIAQSTASDTTTSISTTRQKCTNEVFDMFAIPCPQNRQIPIIKTGMTTFNATSDFALAAYRAIDHVLTSTELMDIQLLPYCPKELTVTTNGEININGLVENTDYQFFKQNNTPVGIMFWCSSAQGTKHINTGISIDLSTAENIKIANDCYLYRLTSPNFNGQFDFNIAKNNGCSGFDIRYAYKPYTPYIQVSPRFNNLYGQDFGDARGLILGGDFSLPTEDTAWSTYQVNNKNYMNIFDREIQNLTFNNKIQKTQAIVQAATGAISSGAQAGILTDNVGVGLIAGAASAAGGIADIAQLKQQQAETLDFKKDLFGYQLGNVQAMPNSVIKVGAFNPTNKIFPIVEFYRCSDKELQAYKDKLKWNGMSVGVIGKIADYIQSAESYIKAQLIRIEGIGDDYHMAVSLAEEINKGVFI